MHFKMDSFYYLKKRVCEIFVDLKQSHDICKKDAMFKIKSRRLEKSYEALPLWI